MAIGIGSGITRRRRAVAAGGSGIPMEATPISNISVARATTGNYVLNMAQGLTGATPWVFCSTPPIGATFPGDNTMVWPKNDMMIGLHEIILWAWNGSGRIERQRFTIDVTPPTILTECKFGVLTIAAAGKIDTNKIAGGPLAMRSRYME